MNPNNVGLATQRKMLLLDKGKNPNFIDRLLLDAQRWSDFRSLLQLHVRQANDFVGELRGNRYLCDDVSLGDRDGIEIAIEKLSKTIKDMGSEVESGLKTLDDRTQQMVELVSVLAWE